ncbi:hypothetical protein [Lacisediminihabitans changchengi]|uniref:VOC family protein n=1 Tax=Lacisediminihabitans changchengi TaxID=2787634 RepID=A0A934VXL9_9MICO|nr:hypothetical protein [Lacisediminihabitans changchengi]MBK4347072.1 hypothetical protein [Lacisediminihabitans changchengi]MBK4347805.1 hypothetical protein [Lacisediminihabitans changchengi]
MPDIEAATAFFVAALGAETIYDLVDKTEDPLTGLDGALGVDPAASITAMRMLDGPVDMLRDEAGNKNYYWYFHAPWGGSFELVAIPSPQEYESTTPIRRWHPPA